MENPLPITSKLLPVSASNLLYLAEVAALTRIATGTMRVLENRPSKQKDPNLSENEKRQAMAERFFVEIIGTLGYMSFLHLGQDLINNIHGRLEAIPVENLTKGAKETLEKYHLDVNRFNDLVAETFNSQAVTKSGVKDRIVQENLLARTLYGETIEKPNAQKPSKMERVAGPKANLSTLRTKFVDEYTKVGRDRAEVEAVFDKVLKHSKGLTNFAKRNNRWASGGIGLGVFLSAAIGGIVIQWANDYMVAPVAKKWLSKKYKETAPKAGHHHNKEIASTAEPHSGQSPHKQALTFLSAAPTLPQMQAMAPKSITGMMPFPSMNGQAPAFFPGYLPNPKIQSMGQGFAYGALRPAPVSTLGGM